MGRGAEKAEGEGDTGVSGMRREPEGELGRRGERRETGEGRMGGRKRKTRSEKCGKTEGRVLWLRRGEPLREPPLRPGHCSPYR